MNRSSSKSPAAVDGRKIVRDLAKQIERRARERFKSKTEKVRECLLQTLNAYWPHSNDETLSLIGSAILNGSEPDETSIFAEIRELNLEIVPSELKTIRNPLGDTERVKS